MKLITKIFFTIILYIFILSNCHREDNTNVSVTPTEYPDQESWNSLLTTTNRGQKTAVIKYGHMQRFNKKEEVVFDENIEIDFFDENGNHTSKLTSHKGKLDEKENKVMAYENVVVVSDSGINLMTEKLWWDSNLEKVISDQFITITTNENDTLYGVGFESDQRLSNWIIKEVRGKTDKNIDLNLKKRKTTAHDSIAKKQDVL